MIDAILSLGFSQFESARYAPKDYLHYKFIRVRRVGDRERRFNPIIQNLMASPDSVLLCTSSRYDYEPRQHVYYKDKWYEIASVNEINEDLNPQSLLLVRGGCAQYILELMECDGYGID